MPATEDYLYPHSHFTPEPHCLPGYTGYLPGFGPHKLYQYGKTYGRLTHDIMAKHPIAGKRFGNILEYTDDDRSSNRRSYDWKSKKKSGHGSIKSNMVSGYTGHIPRKKFYCGKGYQEECRYGIADFEKLQMERRHDDSSYKYCPPEDLLPREVIFCRRLFERPEHRNIPSYATYSNPMNFSQSVYDMSDLDPRKTYMPGYTGYYAGKDFDMGVSHGKGAHQDLCDLTSSRLERLVAERRPKVSEWYTCTKLHASQPPFMIGYHPPEIYPVRPVPGYTGHVPGHRDLGLGASYGRAAGAIMREREIAETRGLREP